MLARLRRTAGLLLALFVGHLTMVVSGAVCTTPGMTAMTGSATETVAMAEMPDMASTMATAGASGDGSSSGGLGSSNHVPCSSPVQGSCVASMPCVTALGAPQADEVAFAAEVSERSVTALTVIMPALSGSAPELPPPRA